MVIFLVAIALAVVQLAALFVGVQFLEREVRRHSLAVQERVAEAKGKVETVNALLVKVQRNIQLSSEDEAAMSKAMEEGISNLLGYSVGKGPGR